MSATDFWPSGKDFRGDGNDFPPAEIVLKCEVGSTKCKVQSVKFECWECVIFISAKLFFHQVEMGQIIFSESRKKNERIAKNRAAYWNSPPDGCLLSIGVEFLYMDDQACPPFAEWA